MTVRSNDRIKPGKTKLERLGECSTAQKGEVFNNIGHILDEELLMEIYKQQDGKKAVGIDGVTKETYGADLEENIRNLIECIRKGTYRPKPGRLTEIPKEDGNKRPLAISCFEDKLVQAAVSSILTKIYEPLFLESSFGFRSGQSCHDALRALNKHTYRCCDGAVVEIDISKYFNTIPHKELKNMLRKKISDDRFLRLIDKLATAPVLENGKTVANTIGCPQGSILSPVLANIFLHEVVDEWFDKIKRNHFAGIAEEIRYADDIIFVFEKYEEAKRFFEVLPKRLKKYGLEMHTKKSSLIRSGRIAAQREHIAGRRLPTYQFLGFTVYWAKARNGNLWRIKYKSRRDRFTAKLHGLKKFLRKNLTTNDTKEILRMVARVIKGWLNYHGISDNHICARQFINISRQIIRKWLNRRGRKRPMNWDNFNKLMEKVNMPKSWKTISMFHNSLKMT